MKQSEIIDELRKLPEPEILAVIEKSLRFIRERFHGSGGREVTKQRLMKASEALLKDYSTDEELTVFAEIDAEDFNE